MAHAALALTGAGLPAWPAGVHLRRWRCRWRTQHRNARQSRWEGIRVLAYFELVRSAT